MTSGQPDLYADLGVSPEATAAEIAHAYRALARRHHPDTRALPPAEAAAADSALRKVLRAYAVLRAPERRAEYDRQLARRHRATPKPAPSPQAPRASQASPQREAERRPEARATGVEPRIQVGPVRWQPDAPPGPADPWEELVAAVLRAARGYPHPPEGFHVSL